MMEGVSKWRYSDDSDAEMRDESEEEDGDKGSEQEHEAKAEFEAGDNEAEPEATPTPTSPKINGKSAGKKTVPLRAKHVPQPKKATPKAKGKAKPKAKPAVIAKGKGKAAVKDVYEFDDSD
jgi:hypothetical protein